MAETQEVITEQQTGTTPGGKRVSREKTQVISEEGERFTAVWSLNRLVYYGFSVIETLLVFRFVLKMLGANAGSPFVSFVYSISSIFERPFRGIFSPTVSTGLESSSVFEPSTIVAFLVYLVIASGIVELINILTATETE